MAAKRPPGQPRVFISHSHRDRAPAVDLQRVLARHGAETFLDQDRIQIADTLPDRIRDGIAWCDVVLLIWSASAASSDWVGREWNLAYELRRKIVPYCLDSAPLPTALENLVHVDRQDAELAHAGLLRAVFGKHFAPAATEIFPGRWRVTLDAFGLGTATYDLELRANGQITGTAKIDQSGAIAALLHSMGAADILGVKPDVSGSWTYEESTEILTLDITAHGLGQQFGEKIQIRTTGREEGEIRGKDLAGRGYSLRRLPGRDLDQALHDLEEAMSRFAAGDMTESTIGQEAAPILAAAEVLDRHRRVARAAGERALADPLERVCDGLTKFAATLAADLPFVTKKLGLKLLAEVLCKQQIRPLREARRSRT